MCLGRSCFKGYYLDLKLVSGDGTVPTKSAVKMGNGLNYNAEGATLIPFIDTRIIPIPFIGESVEHTGLPKNSKVQERVLSILNGPSTPSAFAMKAEAVESEVPQVRLAMESSAVDAEGEPTEAEVQQAYYIKVLGASSARIADPEGNASVILGDELLNLLPDVTSYLLAPDSFLAITPTNQTYTLTFIAGGGPLALDMTKGTDVETVQAIRYLDVVLPAGTPVSLRITPDGVGPLSYDSDGDGTFETTITPTATVSGADAQDVEPPFLAADETIREGKRFVRLAATDAGAGVSSLSYSLDGTSFQTYTGEIEINHPRAAFVYAFAQDNVANRSTLYRFDLKAHPDISLTASASPNPVLSGGSVIYTIMVTNKGAAPAESVSVNNSLPPSVSIVSCTATGGAACAIGTLNDRRVTLNWLDAGATVVITLVGRVNCAAANGTTAGNISVISSQAPDFDHTNNSATAAVEINNPPPVISGLSVDKPMLWPPNNKMVEVIVNYRVADNCGAVTNVLSIKSNEPTGGEVDWEVLSPNKVRLRAERNGSGQGRIYTITLMSTDSAGGKSTKTVAVVVPHDNGKKD